MIFHPQCDLQPISHQRSAVPSCESKFTMLQKSRSLARPPALSTDPKPGPCSTAHACPEAEGFGIKARTAPRDGKDKTQRVISLLSLDVMT